MLINKKIKITKEVSKENLKNDDEKNYKFKYKNKIAMILIFLILIIIMGLTSIKIYKKIGFSFANRQKEIQRQQDEIKKYAKENNIKYGPREIVEIYKIIKEEKENYNYNEKEKHLLNGLSERDKKNIVEFVDTLNKNEVLTKIKVNDLRKMQEIYAKIEWKNDKNLMIKLFGNTSLKKQGELILEKELLGYYYNFGIIGSILYILPYIILTTYIIYLGFRRKSIKYINSNYINYLYLIILTFGLSYNMGSVFHSTNASLLFAIVIVSALNNINIINSKSKK